MLIHHTSGLIDYESQMGIERSEPALPDEVGEQVVDADVLELARTATKTYFAPGTQWRYSNTAYALMALLVEQASGLSFPQFLKDNIFDPLEMTNTLAYAHDDIEVPNRVYGHSRTDDGWTVADQSPTSAVLGDGGVYTSLADLRKWFEFLDGTRTLAISREAFERYLAPGTFGDGSKLVLPELPTQVGPRPKLTAHSYGFGWFFGEFDGVPVMHHGGGTMGFRNMLARDPERKLNVILLTNRNEADVGFLNEVFGYFLNRG
jgi:CubicO group peptidase (beta-lactamase class C family)